MNPNLEAICKKYEYNLPSVVDQILNRYIKEILKDLSESVPARRSGITNMYLSHKFTIVQMMHVSGHKTQKTFMDYIKLSSDEIADEIDAIVNGAKEEVF